MVILAELVFRSSSRSGVFELAQRMDVCTARESGCAYYRHALDVRDPNRIVLSECWQNTDALLTHFRSAHFRDFRHRSRELGLRASLLQFDAKPIAKGDDREWRALLGRAEREV